MTDLSALASLQFDNRFLRELAADPVTRNYPRSVTGAGYSRVAPTPVREPRLLAFSPEVATTLGLDEAVVRSPAFAAVFAGNAVASGMEAYATCYGGHQFGNWASQLGDGRAIGLGEVIGRDGGRWELQLKGAGPTPYSRNGDGRAVLRSSLREFLCSEAMHHLGVPTTRALSLVLTGEQVMRDMFYDGNGRLEPGAVVCRVAPSFTRFGHFELPSSRRDVALLRTWVEHTIRGHFAELAPAAIDADTVVAWLAEVARRTAVMIVGWMRVGFVHGVMNTDNMSILGLTIDYGPYGWIDNYDPNWTPNTTDAMGRRYRFAAQPQVALWNLERLAEALYPLVEDAPKLESALNEYVQTFNREHRAMQRQKLGLAAKDDGGASGASGDDDGLVGELFALLAAVETDMTIFYRRLADVPSAASAEQRLAQLLAAFYEPELTASHRQALDQWLSSYAARLRELGVNDAERRQRMNQVNPAYVLRNYMAQLAIDAAEKGDTSVLDELMALLRHPYDERPEGEPWAGKRPDWARKRAGCSMLSCSS